MANCFYTSRVISELSIDEDASGLIALIPSENEEETLYVVSCEEHKTGVTVKSCSCKGFYYRKSCKHVAIVQSYWDNIYKPVAKIAAPKVRKPRNGLVRKVRGGGLVKVEQKQPVVKVEEETKEEAVEAVKEAEKAICEAEAIVSQPAPKKDMMTATLTKNQGFSILRR
jgi:hypothetical protein